MLCYHYRGLQCHVAIAMGANAATRKVCPTARTFGCRWNDRAAIYPENNTPATAPSSACSNLGSVRTTSVRSYKRVNAHVPGARHSAMVLATAVIYRCSQYHRLSNRFMLEPRTESPKAFDKSSQNPNSPRPKRASERKTARWGIFMPTRN